ncbi:MAG: hypothetical protein QG641_1416, partial [Candidatus Poribacteria bacterium]|nr:hypothetical protein [Candidatus Poribacteria bacterium]
EEKILRSMAYSITSKLINTPIVQLREHTNTKQGYLYVQMATELFNLSIQADNQLSYSQVDEQTDC